MNKLFRVIAALALSACLTAQSWAIPAPPVVEAGSASIVASGDTLTISSTQNTILDWSDFSIGSGETVLFSQPDNSSAVLARVTGGTPSQVLGSLRSNGTLFLINPNGFFFGDGSLVDVWGLSLSNYDLTDADFLAGNFNVRTADNTGNILVDGTIQVAPGGKVSPVSGGNVSLSGGDISLKGGVVRSLPGGSISLAGGSIDIAGDVVLDAGTFSIQTVPKPDTLLLLIGGLGLIGIVLRCGGGFA